MYSQTEPTTEQLLNWIDGRLPTDESARIEAQVAAGDDVLRRNVLWLQAFTGLRQHLVLTSPPATVRDELTSRFAEYAARKESAAQKQGAAQSGFLQRLVAALTFDSAVQLGLAGTRSAQIASARQLIYASDLAEIALNIGQPGATGSVNILGQILPMPGVVPNGFVVQLFQNAEEVALTTTDDLGEFSFEAIQPGEYTMILTYEETAILLAPISLQG